MRKAIASILIAAALAGCDSNAVSNATQLLRVQSDASREQSYGLTRDGVLIQGRGVHVLIALPGWLWAGAPHCAPDLALGPKGEVIITSNVVPTLWKIDPQTFAVTVHSLSLDTDNGKDVGFAAIAYSSEQATFVAYSEVQRSVWKIDALMKSATKIADLDLSRSRKGQRCRDLGKRLIDFIGG